MKLYKLILFVLLILFSCKKENFDCEDIIENNRVYKTSETDKFIITGIEMNGLKKWDNLDLNKISEIKNDTVIKEFVELYEKNFVREYFNRTPNFEISLLSKNKFIGAFLISISTKLDYVYIYDSSYQSYSKIKYSDWTKLLNSSSDKTYKNIKLFDLKIARDIYRYCNSQNLPVVLKNDYQKEWIEYDGQFKFNITKIEDEIEEKEYICRIRHKFKNNKFKIKTSGWSYTCSCKDCNDCMNELTFTIYCNKEFYNKFDLVSPKSRFDEFYAEFEVIGDQKELFKLEKYLTQISDEY